MRCGHSQSISPAVEQCRALDAYQMKRRGLLAPGTVTPWRWSTGRVLLRVDPGAGCTEQVGHITIILPGGDLQCLPLVWLPCPLGGCRPLFACPCCGWRAVKLYQFGGRFQCRRCGGLVYQCQRATAIYRPLDRAFRLQRRLGGEPGFQHGLPLRPKGMHRAIYARHSARYDAVTLAVLAAMLQAVEPACVIV